MINKQFLDAGLRLSTGRIVDARFINAPNSAKNKEHQRDPEMTSGKKGNVWHFGMKIHIATDTVVGIAMNAVYGPANEHDIVRARELIPQETEAVYGDAGCLGMDQARGVPDRQRIGEPKLQDQRPSGAAEGAFVGRHPSQDRAPQVQSALQGRTHVRSHQASDGVPEDPLPRHREERKPPQHPSWARQSVPVGLLGEEV